MTQLFILSGELTDLDAQNSLCVIGEHRITGLNREELKKLAPHLFEIVEIEIRAPDYFRTDPFERGQLP